MLNYVNLWKNNTNKLYILRTMSYNNSAKNSPLNLLTSLAIVYLLDKIIIMHATTRCLMYKFPYLCWASGFIYIRHPIQTWHKKTRKFSLNNSIDQIIDRFCFSLNVLKLLSCACIAREINTHRQLCDAPWKT